MLQVLAEQGKAGFYTGRIAQAIVDCVQKHGGVLSLADLKKHESSYDQPIKTCYRGIDVWEMPPNGQGITALMAFNILEGFDISSESRKYTLFMPISMLSVVCLHDVLCDRVLLLFQVCSTTVLNTCTLL